TFAGNRCRYRLSYLFYSSRRRHTRSKRDWSSDVCSSDLFSHELGIDIWEVIKAAKTKPFGFQAFYPGPGVGGHCIPIDPSYLNYSVRKALGHPFRVVDLAEDINNSMPNYVVQRVQDLLNEHKKSLNGANVLLLGVSYKANIADQRHSPALPVGHGLVDKGANLSYHDANVPTWH